MPSAEPSPFIRLIGQPTGYKGCQHGLRSSSILVHLQLGDTLPEGWLGRLNDVLREPLQDWQLGPGELTGGQTRYGNLGEIAGVLLAILKRFQTKTNLPIFESGRILQINTKSRQLLLILPATAYNMQGTFELFLWLVRLLNAVLCCQDTAPLLAELPSYEKNLIERNSREPNMWRFLQAAHERDIPLIDLPGGVVQFGQGLRGRWMKSSFTDQTPAISTILSKDKRYTAEILRRAGLPAARHERAANEDAALAIARELGYPVVVKPADLDGGVGVSAGLLNEAEVLAAYAIARQHSSQVLVEKHFEGRDYRLTVFHNELIWAVERVPGSVTGNGTDTVAELVKQVNADPRRGEGPRFACKPLKMDQQAMELLDRQGLTLESIPENGRFIRLRRNSNISQGGMPVAMFDKVHPDNRLLAIRAAEALKLDLAGIDLLIPDISRSWMETGACICEVNAQPQLGVITTKHQYPTILRSLIRGNGRIPIALLVGGGPDTLQSEDLAKALETAGRKAGWLDEKGVGVRGRRINQTMTTLDEGGGLLLSDSAVDAMVLRINDTSLLRTGMPFDRFDLLIIAGEKVQSDQDRDRTAGEEELGRLIHHLLPACAGSILISSETKLRIQVPDQKAQLPWKLETLPAGALKQRAVSVMLEADSRHLAG